MAPREMKTLTLDEAEYAIPLMNAREGIAVRAKLLKVVGPILAPLALGKGGKLSEFELTPEMINSAGKALSDNLDSAEVSDLVARLLDSVLINGKSNPGHWAVHFAGNYAAMDRVLIEVVKHNGFFGQLGKVASQLPS